MVALAEARESIRFALAADERMLVAMYFTGAQAHPDLFEAKANHANDTLY